MFACEECTVSSGQGQSGGVVPAVMCAVRVCRQRERVCSGYLLQPEPIGVAVGLDLAKKSERKRV